MYQENQTELPPGDVATVFADILADMQRHAVAGTPPVSPETVLQYGKRANLKRFAAISRRLLLPGSRIVGDRHLKELCRRAAAGESCLLCSIHRSNLDVPTLYVLLADQADENTFHRIIWIAGRKLSEDTAATRVVAECFNRVVITPRSWLTGEHTESDLRDARLLNRAAQRTIMRLRHQGWVFGFFPSGTRIRPADEATAHAIEETDTYVKSFERMLLCHIRGCTLPVSHDWQLTHEIPRLDRMVYTFGPMLDTAQWREQAALRYPDLSQRDASARAVMADISQLAAASG